MRDTRRAQPAIGAVSLGLLRIFEEFGVRPDLVGGHSFGELTALCAAGRLDDRELAILARRRGELMAECATEGGLRGDARGLRSARTSPGVARDQEALDVVVANKNAPRQCVLSGPIAEIERARQILSDRQGRDPSSCRFRRRFTAGSSRTLKNHFSSFSNSITPRDSTIPVFSNATAEPYPKALSKSGHYWRVSSRGRSNSSPRSKRCIERVRGRSSRSVPTRS